MTKQCILLAAILAAAPAMATELFRGDFETGDFSQWSSVESANPSHITVVQSPVTQGSYAMKVVLATGDVIYGGTRNEVDDERDNPTDGEERWYHWRTYFPSDFQSIPSWEVFTQWHQYNGGGSPPVEFDVTNEKLTLLTGGDQQHWSTPLVRGVWHDFIFHVRWSSDPSVGFMELYYDGQLAMPKQYLATLYAGDTVYLKQGLYRDSNYSLTQTVYDDGMVVGTTLQDVQWGGTVSAGGSAGTDAGTSTGSSGGTADAGTSTGGTGDTSDAGTSTGSSGGTADAGTSGGTTGGTADAGTGSTPTPVTQDDGGTPLTLGTPSNAMNVSGGCAALPFRKSGAAWFFLAGPLALAALFVRRRRHRARR